MDPILYWNDVALEANKVSHTNGKREQTGPVLSARALAIVHLAMHDAFAGVSADPTLPPYLTPLPALLPGASLDAAVAAAAHGTLSSLFPSQKPFFDAKHAAAGLAGPGLNEGNAFGVLVAAAILKDRKDDPGVSDDGYAVSMGHTSHRPDPDGPDQGIHGPFYGARSKGFAITARHELAPPPDPATNEFRTALRQVRSRGAAPELLGASGPDNARRTGDETVIGLYWAYDGAVGIGTPPRLFNQIIRELALKRAVPNTPAQNARLFALVNVAMADAGILAWDQKYIHDLCRPVVAIRELDASMGPAGVGGNNLNNDTDVSWLPFGAPNTNVTGGKNNTPPFPAYPSGHATFGAAALHMTRLFYDPKLVGDRSPDKLFKGLTFVSEELNGINKDNKGTVRPRHVRNFPGGLWQMIEENGRSRVYLGVHWVFDAFVVDSADDPDVGRIDPVTGLPFGGVPLGLTIAEDIFATQMKKSTVGPRV